MAKAFNPMNMIQMMNPLNPMNPIHYLSMEQNFRYPEEYGIEDSDFEGGYGGSS